MTSAINPNNIDGSYPVAGQDNNSQGFRDNFTNIKRNFQYAADEIDDLQTNVLLKAALTGTTLNNNMNNNTISAVNLNDVSTTVVPLTGTSGTIAINYSTGQYQTIANTTGSVSLTFNSFPANGFYGAVRVAIYIANTGYTLSFPTVTPGVTQGTTGLQGYSAGTITFASIGTYVFEFSSSDGGTNICITDLSRSLTAFPNANITAGTISASGNITTSGNVFVGSGSNIAIGTTAPDAEVTILAYPQANLYPVTGNSTTSGTDLHISGANGANTRITQDAFGTGSYVAFTGRSARGTAAVPTQTQSGDILAQFTARGFANGTLQFGNVSTGRLDVVAAEYFTDTSRATNVQIFTTAVSSITPTAIATFSSANGLNVGGGILSSATSGGVGYATGAGSTVSQSTNRATAVTLSRPTGQITLFSVAGNTTPTTFTLNNTTIAATDVLVLNQKSGTNIYNMVVSNVVANAANITVWTTGGVTAEAPVINFAVIKGVNS
jgi:hypothetical protein